MQPELKLSVVSGGSYEAGGNKATWAPRKHDPKVIDLDFREKRFEVTQEGRGPNGRPRFLVNRTRQPDRKLLQGRDITELIQKLDRFWPDLIEIPARMERIEGTLDRIEKAVAGKRQRPPERIQGEGAQIIGGPGLVPGRPKAGPTAPNPAARRSAPPPSSR